MGPLPMPESEKLRPWDATVVALKQKASSVGPSSSRMAGLCEMEPFEPFDDPWLEFELCTESFRWMCPCGVVIGDSKTSPAEPDEKWPSLSS